MQILLFTQLASALLLAVISIPMILEKVPPNLWYGFRCRKTLSDPAIWFAVNKHFAQRMLVTSLVFLASSIGFYYVPNIAIEAYSLSCLAIFSFVLGVGLIQSWRYMNSLGL